MLTERVEFQGPHGKLSAKLDLPDGMPRAYGVFAHCFTCSKDVLAANRISQGLAAHGVAMLRFDFAGLGASAGDFGDTNFSSNVEDLVAAAGFLREKFAAPRLLVGHSMGGTAVLAAAHRIPESTAVVTIASPSDPHYVVNALLSEHLDTHSPAGRGAREAGGARFQYPPAVRRGCDAASTGRADRHLGRALLVMHAPNDDTVDIANALRIFELAQYPKSFVSLDGIDHLVTGQGRCGAGGRDDCGVERAVYRRE
jgi:alpha/beta superfamily hydrolase